MPNYGGYAGKNNGNSNYGNSNYGKKGGGNSRPRGGGNNKNTRGNGSGEASNSVVLVISLLLGVPFLLFLASVGYVVLS